MVHGARCRTANSAASTVEVAVAILDAAERRDAPGSRRPHGGQSTEEPAQLCGERVGGGGRGRGDLGDDREHTERLAPDPQRGEWPEGLEVADGVTAHGGERLVRHEGRQQLTGEVAERRRPRGGHHRRRHGRRRVRRARHRGERRRRQPERSRQAGGCRPLGVHRRHRQRRIVDRPGGRWHHGDCRVGAVAAEVVGGLAGTEEGQSVGDGMVGEQLRQLGGAFTRSHADDDEAGEAGGEVAVGDVGGQHGDGHAGVERLGVVGGPTEVGVDDLVGRQRVGLGVRDGRRTEPVGDRVVEPLAQHGRSLRVVADDDPAVGEATHRQRLVDGGRSRRHGREHRGFRRCVRRCRRAHDVGGARRAHTTRQLRPRRGLSLGGVGAGDPAVAPVRLAGGDLAIGQLGPVAVGVDLVGVDADAQLRRRVGRTDVPRLQAHRQEHDRHGCRARRRDRRGSGRRTGSSAGCLAEEEAVAVDGDADRQLQQLRRDVVGGRDAGAERRHAQRAHPAGRRRCRNRSVAR